MGRRRKAKPYEDGRASHGLESHLDEHRGRSRGDSDGEAEKLLKHGRLPADRRWTVTVTNKVLAKVEAELRERLAGEPQGVWHVQGINNIRDGVTGLCEAYTALEEAGWRDDQGRWNPAIEYVGRFKNWLRQGLMDLGLHRPAANLMAGNMAGMVYRTMLDALDTGPAAPDAPDAPERPQATEDASGVGRSEESPPQAE